MSDIGPFPGYFLDDKQYHSRARSVGVLQSDDRLNLTSSENSTQSPSPVQSKCDAHDTIANGSDDISVFCRRRTSLTRPPLAVYYTFQ
ncbi:hypothetical protein TNCV_1882841 [Trichonephila clavipes]|nr:hypothetical protein TNCV_1882841 [Trichonephila clavipes]